MDKIAASKWDKDWISRVSRLKARGDQVLPSRRNERQGTVREGEETKTLRDEGTTNFH